MDGAESWSRMCIYRIRLCVLAGLIEKENKIRGNCAKKKQNKIKYGFCGNRYVGQ
jgi:hypothetical protein